MIRVPSDLAVLAVRQSGNPCVPATLRTWVRRGHIRRYSDGYDLGEIARYLLNRRPV